MNAKDRERQRVFFYSNVHDTHLRFKGTDKGATEDAASDELLSPLKSKRGLRLKWLHRDLSLVGFSALVIMIVV